MNIRAKTVITSILCLLAVLFFAVIFSYVLSNYSTRVSQKTTPYQVEIDFIAPENMTASVQYDYGYGFNQTHSRLFPIAGAEKDTNTIQKIKFSISAWKPVKALKFNGWQNNLSEVKSVSITHSELNCKLSKEQLKMINKGNQLEVRNLSECLK